MRTISGSLVIIAASLGFVSGCGSEFDGVTGSDADLPGGSVAYATIKNDFNNPAMASNPPWTICRSSYMGVDFAGIAIGATSPELPVTAGIDNVLMVAAWNDPTSTWNKISPCPAPTVTVTRIIRATPDSAGTRLDRRPCMASARARCGRRGERGRRGRRRMRDSRSDERVSDPRCSPSADSRSADSRRADRAAPSDQP